MEMSQIGFSTHTLDVNTGSLSLSLSIIIIIFNLCVKCVYLFISSDFCSVCQDGILFGMVGAYDWDGGVLKEGTSGSIMPPREAFESEFPLELKNHAAYLGTAIYHHLVSWT